MIGSGGSKLAPLTPHCLDPAMTESIRLAKRVASMRACSRSEAERIIVGGWVRVDGQIIEEPQFRVIDQQIEIDPSANPAETEPVTLLFHKPSGMHLEQSSAPPLDNRNFWTEDASGQRLLRIHFSHLTACTPLETDASGLVVFSQDWRIARKLTEDAAGVEQEILVEVSGDLTSGRTPEGLKRLNRGVALDGRAAHSLKISWQSETRLRVAMKGVCIDQIAKLCESAGLRVMGMKRIRLGGVAMGKLPVGLWRYLRVNERF